MGHNQLIMGYLSFFLKKKLHTNHHLTMPSSCIRSVIDYLLTNETIRQHLLTIDEDFFQFKTQICLPITVVFRIGFFTLTDRLSAN